MSRRERGSSRLPVNTSGNLWIEEGVKFFERRKDGPRKLPERLKYLSTLHAIVEAYRTGEEAYDKSRKNPKDPGVLFSDVVNELWTNPTAVSDWHDERDEEAAKRLRAFHALCGRIAGEFSQLYPGVEMKVEVSRRMLQRRASERAQVAREDAGETKREQNIHSLRVIHLAWKGIKAERGVGSEEAKRILHREEGVHPKKTERAITLFGSNDDSSAA